jgi:uncharacterized caspase-like protein
MTRTSSQQTTATHTAGPLHLTVRNWIGFIAINARRNSSFVLLALLALVVPRFAAAADEPRQWAILIGIEDYTKAAKLQFTANDVHQVAETLHSHGGMDRERIVEMTDNSEPKLQPRKDNIQRELTEWLKRPVAGDSVIVYFSGHGFRDSDGKLYLAPQDIDPSAPSFTGIPAEWLRDRLAECRAGVKLLVLDACHAGSEKGELQPTTVTSKDLSDTFKQAAGVVTLASSTAEEKSQIWPFKQQSLFSYWLVQGLKGHADENGDGAVTIDELYDYLYNHVTQTAQVRFKLPQTPVRIVGPRTLGVPVVVRLVPQPLKQVLTDMAEQISGAMEERSLERVGVLEFTTDSKLGEMLGANFGLLGRYCAEEMEKRLVDRAAGKYAVVERGRMQAALREQKFGVKDLSTPVALEKLSASAGGMPVMARGTLFDRTGRLVNLRCKLVPTGTDGTLASVGGVAQLNESEWAMLGRSVEITADDRRPDPPNPVEPPKPIDDKIVNRADERSRGPHPLQDPNFAYRIRFVVDGKDRPYVFKKVDDYTECFVGVKPGDVYQMWVENRSGDTCMMRLLVDGLNTLPEKEQTKGVATWLWGQRVNLDDARPWVLDPAAASTVKVKGISTWAVAGFVTETGQFGKLKEFTIVDAEKSLAARQQFTDQIGMITASFYSAVGGSRGKLGTEAGKERGADLTERGGEVGNLLAVVHINYVDADSLKP